MTEKVAVLFVLVFSQVLEGNPANVKSSNFVLRGKKPHPSAEIFTSARELDPIPGCIQELIDSSHSSSLLTESSLHHLNTEHSQHRLLLFLVESTPERWRWRETIRQTWKKYTVNQLHADRQITLVFAVPCKQCSSEDVHTLTQESIKNGDIALFFTVAPATAGSGRLVQYLLFFQQLFGYHFLLRTYDYFYINVPDLLTELTQYKHKHLYMGYFRGSKSPYKEEKWYLCPSLVPHADRGAYILSGTTVSRLIKQYQYLNYYEDDSVSIALWLSPHKDVLFKHEQKFNSGVKGTSRGCRNGFILSPMASEQEMSTTHQRLASGGRLCIEEFDTERTYKYNWSALPTNCCNEHETKLE